MPTSVSQCPIGVAKLQSGKKVLRKLSCYQKELGPLPKSKVYMPITKAILEGSGSTAGSIIKHSSHTGIGMPGPLMGLAAAAAVAVSGACLAIPAAVVDFFGSTVIKNSKNIHNWKLGKYKP